MIQKFLLVVEIEVLVDTKTNSENIGTAISEILNDDNYIIAKTVSSHELILPASEPCKC